MDFGAFASSSSTPVGESKLEVLAAAAAVGVFATAILAALGDEMRAHTGARCECNCPMRNDVNVGVDVERAARALRRAAVRRRSARRWHVAKEAVRDGRRRPVRANARDARPPVRRACHWPGSQLFAARRAPLADHVVLEGPEEELALLRRHDHLQEGVDMRCVLGASSGSSSCVRSPALPFGTAPHLPRGAPCRHIQSRADPGLLRYPAVFQQHCGLPQARPRRRLPGLAARRGRAPTRGARALKL